MALEEKTNNVKYQGRDDYKVVYFDVQEGTENVKYFFLDEGKDRLKNGNIIATTNLKVAIGANKPEELADIGVVSPEGKVVIPFDNRKIKVLTDDILLAEPINPVSENVVKALEDRTNPTEATRLVGAANTIKEKVSNSVGPEGKFVFNDLFSEATIFDIDGNSLVDNKYFSFIAMNNDGIFLSTNDPEAEVVSVPFAGKEVENQENAVAEATEVVEEANPIDVSEAVVDENVVEDAFKEQEESVAEENVENTEAPVEENTTGEEVVEENNEEAVEEISNDVEDSVESENTEPVSETEESEEVENAGEEVTNEEAPIEETEPVSETTEPETTEDEDEEDKTLTDLVTLTPDEEYDEEINVSDDEDELEDNRFDTSKVKVDSIRDDHFDSLIENDELNNSDLAEGTAIVEKIISKMKEQDDKIAKLESQLLEQKDLNRTIVRKAKETEEKLNAIASENDKLEEKSNYYKRVATSLADENSSLKNQLEDKDKLLYMLKEAKKLLGDEENRYDFENEDFLKRIA